MTWSTTPSSLTRTDRMTVRWMKLLDLSKDERFMLPPLGA